MRALFHVVFERRAYLAVGYLLLRLPLAIVYAASAAIFFRSFDNLWSLVLLLPAGLLILGAVVTERAMARSWFGAELAPMAPDRPPDRKWRQRLIDLLANPVTWKSLAFVAVESIVGMAVGVFVLIGITVGFAGTFSAALTLLISVLVAIVMGPSANVPTALPFVAVGGFLTGIAMLLVTLHASIWVARLQVWFVQVMLGMSQSQVAIAAARAEADEQRARAEVADRSRRDLVLNVSHELRNPLATIRAHVDTLRGDPDEPPEDDRKRYLAVLSRETDRLSSLVDELLTLASADTGRLQLEMGPVDAAEVATQVHDAMAPLAWRERRIQLLCNTEGTPSVMADRGRLAQVLMNLVRNAITHTPEGGLVAIEVKPLEAGPVEMSVSDTGAGIAPEEAARIFERFYRSDESRTRATGGFGLGLAIAREMVDAMGGRISVDSLPGQGSRFTVTLARA